MKISIVTGLAVVADYIEEHCLSLLKVIVMILLFPFAIIGYIHMLKKL